MVLLSGGILYSGGTVLIGLVGGPIISLIFPLKKKSYLILAIYLSTLIAEYILQPFLIRDPEITPQVNLLFFLLHIMVVTTTIFLVLRYFIRQNKKNQEKEKLLLRKILPVPIVREIMETGKSSSIRYEDTTILFADFMEFTNIVASIPAQKLVDELNDIFHYFDDIMERHELEKIKTIGDGYLAACGLPESDPIHAIKGVRAAKEMIEYISSRNEGHAIKWKIRIGIHSGPVSAGVVGKNKFTFDIFGDTVNIASRIETAGHEGKINISAYTYDLIKDEIPCEYRGKIEVKGKGKLDMYFVK
jgi:class 3 adenylate cyclase